VATLTPTSGTDPGNTSQARPPFWRDERILRILGQVVAVVVVGGLLYWLINNLITNTSDQGISLDFGVVDQPTNFSIRDDPGFDDRSPIFPNMLWVGIKNTAISAVVGIAIAMILGTLIGIGRLSTNWLVNRMSMLYVETLRNIPPLVIIIFFGFALFTFGPFPPMNPTSPPWEVKLPGTGNTFLLMSNDRWGIPSFATTEGNTMLFWIAVLVALVVAGGVWRWRTKVNIETGQPHRRVLYSFLALLALAIIAFVIAGNPYRISWPVVSESGRVIEGGIATNAGYMAVTVALGLYTASHVAEIVRGSILAVPKGQTEASNALALSGFQRYRFVVLPQASRIAIPPTINQFLNLTKNTSLATAVGYPEITALVKTAIGNGKPAVPLLVILMIIYLSFSLVWSLMLNVVNSRMQLVGR
jgi:general L-amino acid transport system permease protein